MGLKRLIAYLTAAALTLPVVACVNSRSYKSAEDFSGLVQVADNREIFVECRGSGVPTVVLVSGKGNGARDGWGFVLDATDPVRQAPHDLVAIGKGSLQPSPSAVFPSVARLTRVCAYDRPGTGTPQVSTTVTQPHSVDDDVSDLSRILVEINEQGPFIIVAHSYGGLIADLFARTYPQKVAGFVMVDALSEFAKAVSTQKEFEAWDRLNRTTTGNTIEAVQIADAIEQITASPKRPTVPSVVLSADKPWDSNIFEEQRRAAGGELLTWLEWLSAQQLLARSLDAKHVTKTNSGHNIEVYQPELIVEAVKEIIKVSNASQ